MQQIPKKTKETTMKNLSNELTEKLKNELEPSPLLMVCGFDDLHTLFSASIWNKQFVRGSDEYVISKQLTVIKNVQDCIKIISNDKQQNNKDLIQDLKLYVRDLQVPLGFCHFQVCLSRHRYATPCFSGFIAFTVVPKGNGGLTRLRIKLEMLPEVMLYYQNSDGNITVVIITDLKEELGFKYYQGAYRIQDYDLRLYQYCREAVSNHFRENHGIKFKEEHDKSYTDMNSYNYTDIAYLNDEESEYQCYEKSFEKLNNHIAF